MKILSASEARNILINSVGDVYHDIRCINDAITEAAGKGEFTITYKFGTDWQKRDFLKNLYEREGYRVPISPVGVATISWV